MEVESGVFVTGFVRSFFLRGLGNVRLRLYLSYNGIDYS